MLSSTQSLTLAYLQYQVICKTDNMLLTYSFLYYYVSRGFSHLICSWGPQEDTYPLRTFFLSFSISSHYSQMWYSTQECGIPPRSFVAGPWGSLACGDQETGILLRLARFPQSSRNFKSCFLGSFLPVCCSYRIVLILSDNHPDLPGLKFVIPTITGQPISHI